MIAGTSSKVRFHFKRIEYNLQEVISAVSFLIFNNNFQKEVFNEKQNVFDGCTASSRVKAL